MRLHSERAGSVPPKTIRVLAVPYLVLIATTDDSHWKGQLRLKAGCMLKRLPTDTLILGPPLPDYLLLRRRKPTMGFEPATCCLRNRNPLCCVCLQQRCGLLTKPHRISHYTLRTKQQVLCFFAPRCLHSAYSQSRGWK